MNRSVDRPAVSPDGSLRAIDEALRADGAHHIAGASVALAVTGAVSALLIATSDGWWQLPIGMLNLLAIGCWRELAVGERWNVSAARQATV